jgi:hypothetical protein
MSDNLNKRITKLEEKVSHLERLNAPRQHNAETVAPQQNPEQYSDPRPRQSTPANSSPGDRANAASNTRNDGHPWWIRMWAWKPWKRGLTVAAGLAAIAYAIVTYCQWRDLQRNFKTEQRAWISYNKIAITTLKIGLVREICGRSRVRT